jgi:hypothetical protein
MRSKDLFGLIVVAATLFLGGCGSSDMDVEDSDIFYSSHQEDIHKELRSKFLKKNYFWVIHIHFWGNDFGDLKSQETETVLVKPEEGYQFWRRTGFSIPKEGLELQQPAVWIKTFQESENKLFSIRYRHSRQAAALEDMVNLLQCDQSTALAKRIMFLGSGGSHGADALSQFARGLKKRCGRGLDFALIADGITQPLVLPLSKFHGLESDGHCINFYQRLPTQFLGGVPIATCRNYKSLTEDHSQLDAQAAWLSRIILEDLEL